MFKVKVLTKRGSKVIKSFSIYENAKELFTKLCNENPGAGYFIYKEEK